MHSEMLFPEHITDLAADILEKLTAKGETIVVAESCTGGLISAALTAIPGSSDAFYGGFVTYANEAKMAMVGLTQPTLGQHGAVSEPTARAMAEGARRVAGATYGLAVTGIAGPTGGSDDKPVGLVHFALATCDDTHHKRVEFGNLGRQQVRLKAVETGLEMLRDAL